MEIIIIGTTFLKKEEAVKSNIFLSTLLVGIALLVQSCATTATIQGNLSDLKPVIGEWVRPPGGYRLLIKEADGKIKINYINPEQGNINVSQSNVRIEDRNIRIEVTLSDVGYPGSHYELTYDEKTDTLVGKYIHPQRTSNVTFVRDLSAAARPTVTILFPQDMEIVPPSPDLPPGMKAFSGKWFGVWDRILQHVLVVEQINPPKAIAIYAYGSAPSWNINNPSYARVQGEIEPGILKLTLRRTAATVTYRIQPDGTLDATYETRTGISRAKMRRMPE